MRAHVGVGGLARAVRRQISGAAKRPLAAIAAARRVDIRLARERIVADRKVDTLEAPDLVAEPRSLLEFEIARRLHHLFLEVGDGRLQIVADHRIASEEADINPDVIGLGDRAEDVLDAAADRGGCDAVGHIEANGVAQWVFFRARARL